VIGKENDHYKFPIVPDYLSENLLDIAQQEW